MLIKYPAATKSHPLLTDHCNMEQILGVWNSKKNENKAYQTDMSVSFPASIQKHVDPWALNLYHYV